LGRLKGGWEKEEEGGSYSIRRCLHYPRYMLLHLGLDVIVFLALLVHASSRESED
jgi:hypothetical protein